MQLHFLFGTETGTAEFLCEDLETAFSDQHDCKVTSMDEVAPADLQRDTLYVLVTATFGSGDLPSTAIDFFETLERDTPDLSHVRFAVFGLGDRTFGETFNKGSEWLMEQMLACKAQMIGARGIYDAAMADMPEDVAEPWLRETLQSATALQS